MQFLLSAVDFLILDDAIYRRTVVVSKDYLYKLGLFTCFFTFSFHLGFQLEIKSHSFGPWLPSSLQALALSHLFAGNNLDVNDVCVLVYLRDTKTHTSLTFKKSSSSNFLSQKIFFLKTHVVSLDLEANSLDFDA